MIFRNLNEAFTESIVKVAREGCEVHSRGSKQKEILFFNCVIEDPTDLNIEVPIRKFKPDYGIAEWLWYCSRNPDVNNIGQLASIWNKIADNDNNVQSNYGCYLLGEQWDWVKNELLTDPDSRRATLVINQPHHKNENPLDYPCTQYVHFFIRDNELHMGVNMRSNDAVFGFCNDVFTFSMFQQLMLNDLNSHLRSRRMNLYCGALKLGKYYHQAGSFHVYENHFRMMDLICENYYMQTSGNYPECTKFKLKASITTDAIPRFRMPNNTLTKEQINNHVKEARELIYV